MTYEEIKSNFSKNDVVKSLSNGNDYEYSGFLTLVGIGTDSIGYDSLNEDCVVFADGKLANIIAKGINNELNHIKHVIATCKSLGCTPTELLHMDYTKLLGY